MHKLWYRLNFYRVYWWLVMRGKIEGMVNWVWTPRPIWWLVPTLALWGVLVGLFLLLVG